MNLFARCFTGFVLAVLLALFAAAYPTFAFLAGWVASGVWTFFSRPCP